MTTLGYALRRLGVSILLLLLLIFLTFALYKAIPANPAGFLVDMQKATPDQIAKAEAALHLHDPFFKQYGDYLWRLSTAISGSPTRTRISRPTARASARRSARPWCAPLLVTGALVIGGALLALLISIPLGAISRREATVGDRPDDPRGLADRDLHAPTRRRAAAAAVPRQPLGHRSGAWLLLVLRHRR